VKGGVRSQKPSGSVTSMLGVRVYLWLCPKHPNLLT
jgi:hypothetical protein